MPEPMSNADDAAAYVLGTLGARERRRFEGRLKKSPELRTMVRSLEMGSIGLAMAAPHREPPVRIWDGIQAAVTHECEKQDRAKRRIWLRSAAAIAACAVVGWFAYTFLNHRAQSVDSGVMAENGAPQNIPARPEPVIAQATSEKPKTRKPLSEPKPESRSPQRVESATLRERVGDLETQVAHLAQTVTQQQAAHPDFNQLTFLNIVPEGVDGSVNVQVSAPSPELRRALLLGVARQLGWTAPITPPPATPPQSSAPPSSPPPTTQFADANPPASQANPPVAENEPKVEFVDLPPIDTTTSPESETASVETETSPSATAANEETSSRNASSIPAFVSGTNLVFAIDSSLVPPGTETVSFYSANAAGGPTMFHGGVVLGNGATVVTMPVFLQVRAWDSAASPQGSPGRVTFSSVSVGSVTHLYFRLPNSEASSP